MWLHAEATLPKCRHLGSERGGRRGLLAVREPKRLRPTTLSWPHPLKTLKHPGAVATRGVPRENQCQISLQDIVYLEFLSSTLGIPKKSPDQFGSEGFTADDFRPIGGAWIPHSFGGALWNR